MATSGSKTISMDSTYKLYFTWELVSQSIANNTSTVKWTLTWITTRYSNAEFAGLTQSFRWSVIIDGDEDGGSHTVRIDVYSTRFASGTVTIEHDDDGAKTFDYFFGVTTAAGSFTRTGTGELPQILRASSLTVENGTLDAEQTLTITPQNDSYLHKITYKCGNETGYIAGSSSTYASGTSIKWTPPLSLAEQNTSGTSLSATVNLITYTSDGVQLGTKSKTITLSIPSSVVPTVSFTVSDMTDNLSTFGKYVQSKSKLKIEIMASGAQGSSIKSYKTTADGKSYTTATIETDVLKDSGELTISSTVTDSRGRTAKASQTISVYAYELPALGSIEVHRCDADGTASSSGNYLSVTFDATLTSLDSQNDAVYTLMYKKTADTSYTTVTLSDYNGQHSVTGGVAVFEADAASSYDVILKAADHYSTVQRVGVGSSISKLFSVLRHGKGFAIGKVAEEENMLDVAFQSHFRGGVLYPSLPDYADLNEYTTSNTYNGKAGGGYTNCPVETAFTLEVFTAGAGDLIVQRLSDFTMVNAPVYHRHFDGSAWSDWTNESHLHLQQITDDAHLIANGDDLNNYTTPGVYRCATAEIAASLTNSNSEYSSAGFRLIVSATSSASGGVIQTAIYNSTKGKIYWRVQGSDGVWGNWFKIITSDDTVKAAVLNADVLKVVTTSVTTAQINANGYLSSQSVDATAVDGYTLIYPLNVQSNSSYSLVYALWKNASKDAYGYSIRNLSSSAVTPTLSIRGLYVKTS